MISLDNIEYPDLPVADKRDEILKLIKHNNVVIIQGDTGSGKTTQLPKMCLEAGLSEHGIIGVTQPRRIAALSIAERLREELKSKEAVSTKIRFFEEGNSNAPLKVMTDGILLQEYRNDSLLKKYSCIMIDEAHERSLNIDILLGICRTILQKRKDFKLLVTSATIDTDKFSKFFYNAPVVSAEGRIFPVDLEYQCSEDDYEVSMVSECARAILDLQTRKADNLLCFLPTESDILDLRDMLQKDLGRGYDILPLYGRMSAIDQKKIFSKSSKIKIVLATNIAETSLTIPGIAYVVDTGLARVSRYNAQSRIQGLPIEKISQASARQRMGRAGRVKSGICIRLYSREDYNSRVEYTDPEILRSNLANVILQLKSLRLNLDYFPFIEPPPKSSFTGAYRLLYELGALEGSDSKARVSKLGTAMSHLPMDVSLARMLLYAKEENLLHSVLILTAALSIQDVRVTPQDEKEKTKARLAHSQFNDKSSDFITILNIWNELYASFGDMFSYNKLRTFCARNYLSFFRIKEWIELFKQFSRLLKFKSKDMSCSLDSLNEDLLHKCLLSGYLGSVAQKNPEDYNSYHLPGKREAWIFPGSALKKKKPEWLMSAELRETSRLFLSQVAPINPEWIYQLVPNLCSKSYFGEVFNEETGFVETKEEIKFKGMIVAKGRRIQLSKIDGDLACEVFWTQAVIENKIKRPFDFMKHNARVLKKLFEIEEKSRSFGLVPDSLQLLSWYLAKVSQTKGIAISSVKELDKYIQKNGDSIFCFDEKDWMGERKSKEWRETFTNNIRIKGKKLRVNYEFDHSKDNDGLTIFIENEELLAPSSYCYKISAWRKWLIEQCDAYLSRSMRDALDLHRKEFEKVFLNNLKDNSNSSAADALFRAMNHVLKYEGNSFALPKKWEKYHCLHAKLNTLMLDISPELSRTEMLANLVDIYQEDRKLPILYSALDYDVYLLFDVEGGCLFCFGKRELLFQRWMLNLIGFSESSKMVSQSIIEEDEKAWLKHKFSFLNQIMPERSLNFAKDALLYWSADKISDQSAKSLEQSTPVFDILKRKGVKKLNALEDLARLKTSRENSEDSSITIGQNSDDNFKLMATLCSDSMTLGLDAFLYCWKILQQAYNHKLDKDILEKLNFLTKIKFEDSDFFRVARIYSFLNDLKLDLGHLGAFNSFPKSVLEFNDFIKEHRQLMESHRKRWKSKRQSTRTQLISWNMLNDPPKKLFAMLASLESSGLNFQERALEELIIDATMEKTRMKAWRLGAFDGDENKQANEDVFRVDEQKLEELRKLFGH